ncbi:MAG: porin family protein [Carboxylicivirga sp.]|jgi:opacity protein-like surface antigen|nr:porin family protein [Carboxylicivirga sp.]
MKKFLMVVAFFAALSMSSFAQVKFGGGLTMGSKMGINDSFNEKAGFGINARVLFDINEQFKIAPGLTYFFPGAPDGIDLSAWQLNADAHYHFYSTESISLYGIGGLNYSYTKTKFDAQELVDDLFGEGAGSLLGANGSAEESDGEIGVDIGAGISFNQFYGEVKYDSAFEGQIALSFGILFGSK